MTNQYDYTTPTKYEGFYAVFSDCAQGLDPEEVPHYWNLWSEKYQPSNCDFNVFVDMVCESVI